MQPTPTAKLGIQGKNPKNKRCLVHIAAGVVSETRDYTERTENRLDIFSNYAFYTPGSIG
jgi:hypothetical protein